MGRPGPVAAARDFKTTLNALNRVLEPTRSAKDSPAFIVRKETAYALRRGSDVQIDADEFVDLLRRAEQDSGTLDCLRRALSLYHGDYLPDARYADWASAERERLLDLYLHAASRLAQQLLSQGDDDECLGWCKSILQTDPTWEHAYQLMIQLYARRGDHSRVRHTFDRCVRVLRKELDVEPSPDTIECYRSSTR